MMRADPEGFARTNEISSPKFESPNSTSGTVLSIQSSPLSTPSSNASGSRPSSPASSVSSSSSSLTSPKTATASKQRFLAPLFLLVIFTAMNVHQFYQEGNKITTSDWANWLQLGLALGIKGDERHNMTKMTNITNSSLLNETEEVVVIEEPDTYTLVVVRCSANVSWLEEVPKDWRIVVYEKCRKNTAKEYPNMTNLIQHKIGSVGAEECNGYLDYMYDYYYNLTSITVFMHDDGLIPYDTKHEKKLYHTPFYKFESIVNVTQEYLDKEHPFLHFGLAELPERFGRDVYHGQAMKFLWPYFMLPKQQRDGTIKKQVSRPPKKLTFKPAAHFAVRKEQIRMHPRATYYAFLQQVRHARFVQEYYNSRQICCALERMWHIFFGEPPVMPQRAMASDLLNITHCKYCHEPEWAYRD